MSILQLENEDRIQNKGKPLSKRFFNSSRTAIVASQRWVFSNSRRNTWDVN